MFIVISTPGRRGETKVATLISTSLTREQIKEIDTAIFEDSYDKENFRAYNGEVAYDKFIERIEELDPEVTYNEFFATGFFLVKGKLNAN